MSDRAFLSIGEVLDLLKEEFPEVTISKIRFLESQGLLDPERTPSGYRKFYADDVERLQWILRQQRENFLPLRVIRGRLDDLGAEGAGGGAPAAGEDPAPEAPSEAAPEHRRPAGPAGPASREVDGPGPLDQPSLTDNAFSPEELGSATGLDPSALAELRKFGLVVPRVVAGEEYFDEDAVAVARLAAAFARHGVGPRHLRMYKVAAEREAGFYEQVVLPLVKQRNPAARRSALDTLAELARLGESMRGALLRAALRQHTD